MDSTWSNERLPEEPLPRTRHNLPASLTPLIGRDDEQLLLLERLRDPSYRLLTISGAGGVGKTRLALEAAAALVGGDAKESPFTHGIFLVPLATLVAREPLDDALATTVASALGLVLSGPEAALTQVINYLREKSTLLVLDNFEHLLAASSVVATLLQALPGLTLLVTSRERLHLRGEWVVELDGLPCPPQNATLSPAQAERYGAVQLFVQAAGSHAAEASLHATASAAMSRICRLVGGVPLGIELAASWTPFLSVREIADELEQSLDLLSSNAPDVPERQRSMRAVFDSSWGLLTPSEQQALSRLAVFEGSFTRGAAATVADTSLPLLASLVNKSLVRRVAGSEPETRYALLDPLRQYAAEHLAATGEAEATASRHAAYYLALLAARTADLRSPMQPEALADLSAWIAESRAAWRWAVARSDRDAIGLASDALFHLYDMRSWFREGAEVFGAAQAALAPGVSNAAEQRVWGKLLARQGWFTFHCGLPHEACTLFDQSIGVLRAANATTDLAWALSYAGAVCSYLGAFAQTAAFCHESLALSEASDDVYGQVIAQSVLSQAAYEQGDYAAAQHWGERSLALEQQIGSPWSIAFSLINRGKVEAALGHHEAARKLFAQCLEIRQALGDIRGAAICLGRLGATAEATGAAAAAAADYALSLSLFHEIGNQWGMAGTLLSLSRLTIERAPLPVTARLLHESLRLALTVGTVPQISAAITACGPLLRRRGDTTWAVALEATDGSQPTAATYAHEQAIRLLSWLEALSAEAPMTIEQATAAVMKVAQAAPTLSPAPLALPAGLTTREAEVLRLVATGLTDAQVADQLVLSRRTIHAHLSSIYGKLGVNTRSAATRFAIEHGLA